MEVPTQTVWFGDGREQEVLHHIFNLPRLEQLRGRPEAILAEIDNWSQKNKILMTIGQERGSIITNLIVNTKPKVMAELGGYIGYSAIKFGSAVRNSGGTRYLSFEQNVEWASIATKLIGLAGLQDFVTIVPGSSSESLMIFGSQQPVPQIDILFLDHAETLYRRDLGICEQLGLITSGAYVVADNVSGPRTRDYVAWVMQGDKNERSFEAENKIYDSYMSSHTLPNGETDGMIVSRYK
ncbi:hypothetical protein PENPOL_c036G00109 [Penicillium polonicum]|uniref:catechol O-methyltransferase n=1 Tax=Penicillium polonicum TaxID=60169 RepID=A0A1V6N5S9_PENPO|nr:hypothetical protein PENPOL_c036G00109 [Penicillium polonicum]